MKESFGKNYLKKSIILGKKIYNKYMGFFMKDGFINENS